MNNITKVFFYYDMLPHSILHGIGLKVEAIGKVAVSQKCKYSQGRKYGVLIEDKLHLSSLNMRLLCSQNWEQQLKNNFLLGRVTCRETYKDCCVLDWYQRQYTISILQDSKTNKGNYSLYIRHKVLPCFLPPLMCHSTLINMGQYITKHCNSSQKMTWIKYVIKKYINPPVFHCANGNNNKHTSCQYQMTPPQEESL